MSEKIVCEVCWELVKEVLESKGTFMCAECYERIVLEK